MMMSSEQRRPFTTSMGLFCLLLLLWVPTTCLAFSFKGIQQQQRYRGASTALRYNEEDDSLSFNPVEGYRSVDIPRAEYCAKNFGVCSVEEMQDLRNST